MSAIEIAPLSRGALLARATLAAGALYGAVVAGPLVARAFGQGGDVAFVEFALTLEQIAVALYARALDELDLGAETRETVETIRSNEDEHVDALTATIARLGGEPPDAPAIAVELSDEGTFLELAQTLEDLGVSAYNGAMPSIRSRELVTITGAMANVEARHAAQIRLARNEPPAPWALDAPLDQRQVLRAIDPFVTS